MIEAVNWQRAVISEHASFKEAFQNLNDVAIRMVKRRSSRGLLRGSYIWRHQQWRQRNFNFQTYQEYLAVNAKNIATFFGVLATHPT